MTVPVLRHCAVTLTERERAVGVAMSTKVDVTYSDP